MSAKLAILRVLLQEMADLTEPECSTACNRPHSCCDPMYCAVTADYAKSSYGITLEQTGHPTLPFMGPTGCTVQPYLRPLCSVHTCDISSFGFKKDDPDGAWTQQYFDLRDRINDLMFETSNG